MINDMDIISNGSRMAYKEIGLAAKLYLLVYCTRICLHQADTAGPQDVASFPDHTVRHTIPLPPTVPGTTYPFEIMT